MDTRAWTIALLVSAALIAGNSGCYLDQLRQEQMANRQLRAHSEQLNNELLEARTTGDALKNQLDARQSELAALKQNITTLQDQAGAYDEARRKAQAALEEMIKRGPGDPIVITRRLPPELDTRLQQFAQRYPDKVEYIPEEGVVRWKADLLFALGSDEVVNPAKPSLKEFAEIVNSSEAANFEPLIVGHTDNKPIKRPETFREHKTNWHLSAHRAISVMNVLKDFGVSESRMVVAGCGEWRPVAANRAGPAAQARNRRVEIFLVGRNQLPRGDATARAQ